ncbi:MAG: ABC transporter substrate-binding protein [Lachnospiraceae bacterium]|nr:ABC transporter substrate-binding protein [Lachnospiraceae bacterium]
MKAWKNKMGMLSVVMAAVTLAGGMSASAEEKKSLEVEVLYVGDALDAFRTIVSDFSEKSGVEVDLIAPGSDYETVMKTRMGSGDMPDVFVTHGWSLARYKEYLLSVNDEAWFDTIGDSVKGVVEDEDGQVYVLPVTQLINGITYNKDVLEKAGVDSSAIRTVEDFKAACEKIRESGVTPLFLGAKDDWTSASLLNIFCPAYYSAEGSNYYAAEQLKDGSFNWNEEGKYVFEDLLQMLQNGYFNEDLITADEPQAYEALATGNCAFQFGGVFVDQIQKYNPDANIGALPIPSTSEEGKSQYAIGEGSAFGIWKDSDALDEAKEFLAYLAEPEVANQISDLDGQIPALNTMDTAENKTYTAFADSEEAFADDLDYDNLFDREYLPSGMWSVLTDSVMELVMDQTENGVTTAADTMQTNYVEKMEIVQ